MNQELEEVKGIVSNPPPEIPEQLLRALGKDAKNLQKFFDSVSEASASWLLNLRTAAEAEKVPSLLQFSLQVLFFLKPRKIRVCLFSRQDMLCVKNRMLPNDSLPSNKGKCCFLCACLNLWAFEGWKS